MPVIEKGDVKNALKASGDARAQAFADDVQVLNSIWRVLNTSAELVADAHERRGHVGGGSAATSMAKKGLAVAGIAESKDASGIVKVLTFVGGQMVATAELGTALPYSPGKASVFITLKVAEKVVSAAGLGQVDKCKYALAALTVSIGANVFACVGTVGALCILGAASLALEAINAHAQCRLPPG